MSQISVSRLRRKPSLVRGKEESATQRAERKKFIRSMMEERTSKFEDTTLTEQVMGKDNQPLTHKEGGRDVPVVRPISQAFELSRAIEVATHGWGLGKKFPITKENILAFKKLTNIATLYEQDLGPDHPATKWILGKLQNHALTLWPRGNTYDAKEIDMVEAKSDAQEILTKMLAERYGANLPISPDIKKQEQQEGE
ncbi:MAG: hypothetical protein UY32_C0029G0005 [Candidatus Jorgensenbacteria bacterium GW2011_GWC1_48_8]|uniref:Uncharacterized protein n=1 Tax=Candidatus Jorgensenbacteria bacterium GW2011_GWC1_48_8 TaxID=1618666 RepID=A0A0G1X6L5_9BACT|nr:MAG: hypothetical protein UY32_C0029G0005 [Candidatus Jorgensenbacteria bacterium GW2011_GWC1_48_8]